jgi:hypothetical protein
MWGMVKEDKQFMTNLLKFFLKSRGRWGGAEKFPFPYR